MAKKVKVAMIDTLMKSQPNTFRSIFMRKKSKNGGDPSPSDSPKSIPQLSPFANSVVVRCSKYFSSFFPLISIFVFAKLFLCCYHVYLFAYIVVLTLEALSYIINWYFRTSDCDVFTMYYLIL